MGHRHRSAERVAKDGIGPDATNLTAAIHTASGVAV
jgi:hypothetical protein